MKISYFINNRSNFTVTFMKAGITPEAKEFSSFKINEAVPVSKPTCKDLEAVFIKQKQTKKQDRLKIYHFFHLTKRFTGQMTP